MGRNRLNGIRVITITLVISGEILKHGIYIPLSLPLKEWIRVRTKLVAGEVFTFQDRQDSCLPSTARLDSPEDQGKGKVLPRQVLFLQEYNFLQG